MSIVEGAVDSLLGLSGSPNDLIESLIDILFDSEATPKLILFARRALS